MFFAETGLLGLVAFFWLMVVFFKESIECIRMRSNKFVQGVGIGVCASFVAITLHMNFDMFKTDVAINSIFILCALCSAGKKIIEKDQVTN